MSRPFGSMNKCRRRVEEILASKRFEPLEDIIDLARSIEGVWKGRAPMYDGATSLEVGVLYFRVLSEIMQYTYPKMKQVEINDTTPDMAERAPSEVQIEMMRAIASRLGYSFEPRRELPAPPANGGNGSNGGAKH